MSGITNVVTIDESGIAKVDSTGAPIPGVNSLWVSCAVGFEWGRIPALDAGIQGILRTRLLNRCEELKAANLRRYLPAGTTVADVAADLAAIVSSVSAQVWICGTRAGCRPVPKFPRPNPKPKDLVRQLLFERIGGYATPKYFPPDSWEVIWDLSETRELFDFSADLAAFKNLVTAYPLNLSIHRAILGGLSHDWAGIQIADVYANFALHKIGMGLGLPDAQADRAAAFDQFMEPTLKRDNAGKCVGWKYWS
jgi:hypothetical protein